MKPLLKIKNIFCYKKRSQDMNKCEMGQIVTLLTIPMLKTEEEKKMEL